MGKTEDELVRDVVPTSPEPAIENAVRRCPSCRPVGRFVSLRCVAALLVGIAVLLSAVFWLPPFFRRGSAAGGPDQERQYGADIVASFILQKPTHLVDANVARLEYDIFEEIGVPNTTVAVMYLEPLGINSTNVVFGVWLYTKNSHTLTELSILKSSFSSLVLQQTSLHLTMPLFGNAYFFQILKFPGGITITPSQKGFLLQKENTVFNFTLNFPIYRVQDKIGELKDQLKLGLHLKSYEILFVRLTNIEGSTVVSPTIVETSIVLAVGNNQPSVPRLKELAQNIRNSSAGNLGLNHTVFGKVKQIQLSSFLQHSFSGAGFSMSPSPAPQPSVGRHHRHSSHGHHHMHHSDAHTVPAPAPRPIFTPIAPPPPSCRFSFSRKPKRKPQIVSVAAPAPAHHLSSSQLNGDVHSSSPSPSTSLHPKSHIPTVSFARAKSPDHATDVGSQEKTPTISPSQASSGKKKPLWSFVLLLYLPVL